MAPSPPRRPGPWTLPGLPLLVVAAALLLLLPASPGSAAPAVGYAWQVKILETGVELTGSSGIALDASGLPVVAYADAASGAVRFGRFDGVAWRLETVPAGGSAWGPVGLVVDAQDRPHLSFVDAWTGRLRYAEKTAAGWRVLDVDKVHFEGHNSISLDPSGVPHLAYPWDDGKLRHARLEGSSWVTETVDPSVVTARYTSLAFDSAGRGHIAYYGNAHLLHARWIGYRWVVETIDNASPLFVTLAIDADDVPRVAYLADRAIRYTVWNGTAWMREVIDADGDGYDARLALDGLGRPHVSYYDRRAGFLRYAHNLGSGWERHTVDLTYISGWYSGIAAGPSGQPHFLYYSWDDRTVRYAVGAAGFGIRTWHARLVTPTSATLPAELTSLGNETDVELFVEWRTPGGDWLRAGSARVSSPSLVEMPVDGLEPRTTYEFRAGAVAAGGTVYAEVRTFETPALPVETLDLRVVISAAVAIGAATLLASFWFARRREGGGG